MTLTFITNFIHHHQIYLADEFYKILGDDYKYVACEPLPEWLIRGGYDPNISRPYILRAYDEDDLLKEAERLARVSDVVIIGSAPEYMVKQRLKQNKITFHYSERWFKNISYHILSPRLWFRIWNNHIKYRNNRSYMLCASAYTAPDVHKVFAYPNKCFKWGYFTNVVDFDFEASFVSKQGNVTHLMWCARFLAWKHPELPIELARRLKDRGYRFRLDMFGSGEELDKIKSLVLSLGVEDVVSFKGNLPNSEILLEMRKHDIFLFTSDRNEGWGVVTNEAMSNGCVFVGSNVIGSVPFLVKDGENGLVFESENVDSLTEKVMYLLDNPQECKRLARNALYSMLNMWSPKIAAGNFITLCRSIEGKQCNPILEGPCSNAE